MYWPVTPVLSSTGTAVALPDASVKTSGLSAGLLEAARDAHAEKSFLDVVEDDPLVERGQRREPIDGARSRRRRGR